MKGCVKRHGHESAIVFVGGEPTEEAFQFVVSLQDLSKNLLWSLMLHEVVDIDEIDLKELFDYHCGRVNTVSLTLDNTPEGW